jgi:hypothetical protein
MFKEPRNRFQGIDSASLFSLAGRYVKEGVVPAYQAGEGDRFLGSLKGLKIWAQVSTALKPRSIQEADRRPEKAAEEEEEDQAPETRIDVEVPKIKTDLGMSHNRTLCLNIRHLFTFLNGCGS